MQLQKTLAAILWAVTTLACATEENAPLDIFIVTGTRIAQPLKQSLSSATVITQQDIQDSQAIDVPSVLKNLAGIEFYQSGGIGKQSSLFMRGSNSNQVLVLVDGVRINSVTTGATALDQLMLDQVERIEVVRGNVSSLYGSEAVGGVIQIFTKRGQGKLAFNASGGGGSYHTQHLAAGLGGEMGGTALDIQLSQYRTRGVSAIKPGMVPTVNPDQDGYDNLSASASLRQTFTPDFSLSASLYDSQGETETDNSFGQVDDVNSSEAHIKKRSLVSDHHINDIWQSKLQWAQGTDGTHNFLNGMPDSALGAQFETINNQIIWQNTLQVGARNTLNLGLEDLTQKVASDTAYTVSRRAAKSLFAGYVGNYDTHQAQINLRHDRYSDFGIANTGLLGYGYIINARWRVTINSSTAFKAPTLNDLFYPFTDFGFGYSYQGNPNLRPERSRNKELAVHYAVQGQNVDVVYFDNHIRDLIASNGQPAGTTINLDQANNNGVELSYAGQFAATTVKIAWTAQNPRDTNTGLALVRRAQSFGNMAVSHKLDAWRAGADVQYSGTREDYDINTLARTTLGSYTLVNLTADYDVTKQLKLSLRADNIFQQDYMLAHGYNTLGRTLFVGLHYQQ